MLPRPSRQGFSGQVFFPLFSHSLELIDGNIISLYVLIVHKTAEDITNDFIKLAQNCSVCWPVLGVRILGTFYHAQEASREI